ncbi:MAG: hypothetical protein AAGF26_04725 [Cyanobacteria bacterium P01_G01_bin.49]
MIIADLDCLETVSQTEEIEGGMIDLNALFGRAMSNFSFDSLAVGDFGAFGGGETNVLTTGSVGSFSVGYAFDYSSVALGLPV